MAVNYDIVLSTTEPNNNIGLLKIRQFDEETQKLNVTITENGVLKKYEGLQAFFCAKIGQTNGLGIIEQKLTESEMTKPDEGKLEYTMRPEDWQKTGQQIGYFSFRKMKNDHEFVEQFSTRDFNFTITKGIFSDGITEVKKDGSTYVWTIEDLLRLFNEYIELGKTDWEEFVEQNKEVLESVDPGGTIIAELINSRKDSEGNYHPSLKERIDSDVGIKSEFRDWDADLVSKMKNEFTESYINLKWFGATGDYTANDATPILDASSSQKVLDVPIYVPDGIYRAEMSSADEQSINWDVFFGFGHIIVNNVKKEISALTNKRSEKKFQNNLTFKRNTWGTFDDAATLSVISNRDMRSQALGISANEPHKLADYTNRDSVGLFFSNSTSSNYYDREVVIYDADSVTLKTMSGDEEIRIGMIVDTKHTPKYSAFITKVDWLTNKIYVSGWFRLGNNSIGQIPDNSAGIRINPTTAIWGGNLVMHLDPTDPNMSARALEIDILNNQLHRDDVDGFDFVSMGDTHVNAALKVRSKNSTLWRYALQAFNTEVGFEANAPNIGTDIKKARDVGHRVTDTNVGFLANDSDGGRVLVRGNSNGTIFDMRTDGRLDYLKLRQGTTNSNNQINSDVSIQMLTGSGITMPLPEGKNAGRIIILINTTNNNLGVTGRFRRTGENGSSLFIAAHSAAMVISDASNWWHIDLSNAVIG